MVGRQLIRIKSKLFEIVLEGGKAYRLAIIKKGERIMHHMLLEQ